MTVSFHYGKHHKGYVTNLNKLIAGTEYAGMSLGNIVKATAGKAVTIPMNGNGQRHGASCFLIFNQK